MEVALAEGYPNLLNKSELAGGAATFDEPAEAIISRKELMEATTRLFCKNNAESLSENLDMFKHHIIADDPENELVRMFIVIPRTTDHERFFFFLARTSTVANAPRRYLDGVFYELTCFKSNNRWITFPRNVNLNPAKIITAKVLSQFYPSETLLRIRPLFGENEQERAARYPTSIKNEYIRIACPYLVMAVRRSSLSKNQMLFSPEDYRKFQDYRILLTENLEAREAQIIADRANKERQRTNVNTRLLPPPDKDTWDMLLD